MSRFLDLLEKTPLSADTLYRLRHVPLVQGGKKISADLDRLFGCSLDLLFQTLGFVPDARQRLALESDSKRVILNCSRQWGKSSVTSLKAIHSALQAPKSNVLVMSPSERQSGEFLRKVLEYLTILGFRNLRGDGVNKKSVVLPNGSRVVALPGVEATMRGFSAVDLLIIDEASRVRDRQYEAAGPMLAVKDGALWLLSPPYGARGFFWKEWEVGGEEWFRLQVPVTDCPRISEAFLQKENKEKNEKKRISADGYRQEYLCEFLGAADGPFRKELLDDAMEEGLEDLL